MSIIIVIAIIAGVIYLRGITEPAELKRLIQGRPQEQQDVIKYFFGKNSFPGEGFLAKRITDEEYDSLVASTVKQNSFKQSDSS